MWEHAIFLFLPCVYRSTAPKEMMSNKQRIGGGEIRRRVHIIRLQKDEIYGIIIAQIVLIIIRLRGELCLIVR